MKICLVEDDLELGHSLQALLQDHGHDVVWVRRLSEARYWLEQKAFAALVLDLSLPGVDGLDVLKLARRSGLRTPVLILTARGTVGDKVLGLNAGADDYLPKPVSRAELIKAVGSRLERAKQQKQRFQPNFDDPKPLEKLGLSPREAEVLLWVTQGKGNHEIAGILGLSVATVKKHTIHIFEKLGVESRTAAMLRAVEALA